MCCREPFSVSYFVSRSISQYIVERVIWLMGFRVLSPVSLSCVFLWVSQRLLLDLCPGSKLALFDDLVAWEVK